MRRGNARGGARQMAFETPRYNDNLRDLDMELDMLKRQRLILQQKQALLDRETEFAQRQSNFNEPSSSYFNHRGTNSAAEFSNLYDGPTNRQGTKRPPAKSWQNAPPKRSNVRSINPWATGGETSLSSGFPESSIQPLMGRKTESVVKKQFSAKPRPNFKPRAEFKSRPNPKARPELKTRPHFANKVTKPKVASKQVLTKWNEEAMKLASDMLQSRPKSPIASVLRPGKQPTPQMRGRMELALGNLLKEVKLKFSGNPELSVCFHTVHAERTLKQTVRQRINEVLLNKSFKNATEILAYYRQEYPESTDEELLKIVKQSIKPIRVVPNKSKFVPGNKDKYKTYILSLLDEKVSEMFGKLEKLYENKDVEILNLIDELPDLYDSSESNINNSSKENSVSTEKDAVGKNTTDTNVEEGSTEEKKVEEKGIEETIEKIAEDKNAEEKSVEDKSSDEKSSIEKRKKKMDDYFKFTQYMIEKSLPKILPRFKNSLITMLCGHIEKKIKSDKVIVANIDLTDQMDAEEKNKNKLNKSKDDAKMATESEVNVENTSQAEEPTEGGTVNKPVATTPKPASASASAAHSGPYYVKLFGRPNLPSKAVIYEFLNQYKPASIKKHKSVNNLLVIAFNLREDYEKIVAKNECVVGGSTLFIKASEQMNESTPKSTPQKVNPQTSAPNKEPDASEESTKNVDESKSTEEEKTVPIEEQKSTENGNVEEKVDAESQETKTEEPVKSENEEERKLDPVQEIDESNEESVKDGDNLPEDVKAKNVANVTKEVVGTPTRTSSRLATLTPSTIKTRRSSKLQN